jgi:hypothetical protein
MRISVAVIAFALLSAIPATGIAQSDLTPSEQFDLDCATAALNTSNNAQQAGQQEAADSAYETALFYEGRLTAEDEQRNWLQELKRQTDEHPRDAESYGSVEVACMHHEQQLLKMPYSAG